MAVIEKLYERPCPAGCRAIHPEFGMVEVLEVRGDKRLVLFALPDGGEEGYETREVPFSALRACDPVRDLQVPKSAPHHASATVLTFAPRRTSAAVLTFPFAPRKA